MVTANTRQRCLRVGIDVGGTFTDIVLGDLDTGALLNYKEPSTPEDPSLGVISGMAAAMGRFGVEPDSILSVVHGTTIGLNAVLQRKGARLALVVSDGNRDILEIARGSMPSPYDMYARKDVPLVSRDLVFECNARAAPDGSITAFPEPDEIDSLAGHLRKAEVESVAVAILHGYANTELECRLVRELSSRLPKLQFTASSETWPEMREYERALVACLNAFIVPLKRRYFERLESGLRDLGIDSPILISTSNGGCISVQAARERPIETMLSGPASGVVAASGLAATLPNRNVVTFDMGGTSADMSVCEGGLPQTTTSTHIGEFPLVTPVVGVSAIGAGGGSILWVDPEGLLKVGPESAGADPGPVCFGRGGDRPTLTDCYVALGFIDPSQFLGGRMRLDRAAAVETLRGLGDQLGFSGLDMAERVASAGLRIATAKMAGELLKGLARQGADPRDYVMVPYGGAGPTNAAFLAEEARIGQIAVPQAPGLFCALGALTSDLRRDFVRSLPRQTWDDLGRELAKVFAELAAAGSDWLASEGIAVRDRELRFSTDMRYLGQAYDIGVVLPEAVAVSGCITETLKLFHAEHLRIHGFADDTAPVELRNLRVVAIGHTGKPPAHSVGAPDKPVKPDRRRCYLADRWTDADVHRRSDLAPGCPVMGPAVLEQDDTTVVVPSGWQVKVTERGDLLLSKEGLS